MGKNNFEQKIYVDPDGDEFALTEQILVGSKKRILTAEKTFICLHLSEFFEFNHIFTENFGDEGAYIFGQPEANNHLREIGFPLLLRPTPTKTTMQFYKRYLTMMSSDIDCNN